MWKLNRRTALAFAAAAALVWAPASLAQGGSPQGQPQGQPGQPPGTGAGQATIDDATLDRFASAYLAIEEIRGDYSQRLQQASDQEQATELQREAQEEMLQVVRENDLTVKDYNQVATMMSQHPEVRERVSQKIEEKR